MQKLKEISIVMLVLFLLVGVCGAIEGIYPYDTAAQRVNPGQMHTAHNAWVVIDATTSADNEPGDPNAVERTYALISAMIDNAAAASDYNGEISIYGDDAAERTNMLSWNGVRFWCIGTDGANVIYEIYLGTLEVGDTDCELSYAGQLDFTIGKQVSTTSNYTLADTLTVTAGERTKSWGSSSPTGDRVAEASIDFQGANIIVAVCTTTSCDTKLLAKGY